MPQSSRQRSTARQSSGRGFDRNEPAAHLRLEGVSSCATHQAKQRSNVRKRVCTTIVLSQKRFELSHANLESGLYSRRGRCRAHATLRIFWLLFDQDQIVRSEVRHHELVVFGRFVRADEERDVALPQQQLAFQPLADRIDGQLFIKFE